ncbi:MAG: PspC domain-containing protein [Chlorobi bacterium]|nr:PspC domain-containing protein [Chlorobiota bacterium]
MKQIKSIILNEKAYKITEDAYLLLFDFLNHIKKTSSSSSYYDSEIQTSILIDMELEQRKQQIADIPVIEEVIRTMKENRKIKYKEKFYENEKFRKKEKLTNTRKGLYRKLSDKILGGVCSGIADKLNTDPVIIRILFLLAALFKGYFIPVYILLWIIIPPETEQTKPGKTVSL